AAAEAGGPRAPEAAAGAGGRGRVCLAGPAEGVFFRHHRRARALLAALAGAALPADGGLPCQGQAEVPCRGRGRHLGHAPAGLRQPLLLLRGARGPPSHRRRGSGSDPRAAPLLLLPGAGQTRRQARAQPQPAQRGHPRQHPALAAALAAAAPRPGARPARGGVPGRGAAVPGAGGAARCQRPALPVRRRRRARRRPGRPRGPGRRGRAPARRRQSAVSFASAGEGGEGQPRTSSRLSAGSGVGESRRAALSVQLLAPGEEAA
ncbi:unnamed protein product, partial [Prorocentrum cordatum]